VRAGIRAAWRAGSAALTAATRSGGAVTKDIRVMAATSS
jgi:hypothetical protein